MSVNTYKAAVTQATAILRDVQLSLGIMATIGNTLVCLTILKTKALHNVTNYMLLNLAVADAFLGVINIMRPTIVDWHRRGIGIYGYCTPTFIYNFCFFFIFGYFRKTSFPLSVLGLSLATFERYIGIVKPLHYSNFFTKRRVTVMVTAVWLVPFTTELYTPIFYIPNYIADNCTVPAWKDHPSVVVPMVFTLILVFIIPSAGMAYMYASILINLKQGARHLENQGIRGPPQELYRAHKKVTKSLIIVITAYFIFIIPDQILRTITLGGNYFDRNYLLSELFDTGNSVMVSINSALNPIVYSFGYSQLRRACIAMLCPFDRCKRSNQVTQITT